MAQRLLGLAKSAFRVPLKPLDDVLNPWAVATPLQHVWYGVDALRERGLLAERNDAAVMLDTLIARLKANNVAHPHSFYPRGFGHVDTVRDFAHKLSDMSVWAREDPADVSVRLTRSLHGRRYASVWEGSMPTVLPLRELPRESLAANFQLVLPTSWTADSTSTAFNSPVVTEMGTARPLVLLLAGTGEQGFMRRRHLLSYPLARMGIASLIMESPYYGKRRPAGQHGSKIAHASDLCVMGRVTIEEARSLVRWASSQDLDALSSTLQRSDSAVVANTGAPARVPFFRNVVLAGTSMGGLHSAMVASTLSGTSCARVGVCSWLGPPSASQVFTLGALANSVDWSAFTSALQDLEQCRRITQACEEIDALLRDPVRHAGVAKEEVRRAAEDAVANAQSVVDSEQINAGVGKQAFVGQAGGASGHLGVIVWQRVQQAVGRKHAQQSAEHAVNVRRARVLLTQMLRVTDITSFMPPARPDACIFTTAAHDQYVLNTDAVKRMWAHVRQEWQGCDVRSVAGGHVSASILSTHRYLSTIVEVVRRLRGTA